jgi:predicted enzyme related to lactoylglutathione lyase
MEGYSLVSTGPEPGPGIGEGIGAMPGSPCNVTVYVQVEDITATLGAIEKLGGHQAYGPEAVPGGGPTVAGFVDSEGHLIGLIQEPAAG